MFSISELKALVAVAKHKSFRRAAVELNISVSTLSLQISQLEKKFQIRLFNRTTRSVSLTQAGTSLIERINPALYEIFSAFDDINDFREKPSGNIRINASASACRLVLIPFFQKFLQSHPDIKIELVSDDKLIDIAAEGFDFGLRNSDSVAQDMIALPIGPKEHRYAVVGSPNYFKKYGKPEHPNDLLKQHCIRYRLGSGVVYQWEFERRGRKFEVDAPGSLIVDDDSLALIASLHGTGLSYQSEWAVNKYIKSGKLLRCLESWTPPHPALSLYYSSSRHKSNAVRMLINHIRENNEQLSSKFF